MGRKYGVRPRRATGPAEWGRYGTRGATGAGQPSAAHEAESDPEQEREEECENETHGNLLGRESKRRWRARRQSRSDPTTHAAMNGTAAEKHTRARP